MNTLAAHTVKASSTSTGWFVAEQKTGWTAVGVCEGLDATKKYREWPPV